ncbi:hypothetical protein LguiA_008116 [Lonicera macranthoides]
MGKGGKLGFNGNSRRGVSLKEQGSDESDEDYNVGADEEFDESDDCSFDGDESEVSLGEFEYEEVEEEEEEEEEEEIKVRKVAKTKGRRSFPGRKEHLVMKPQKRKRVSYKEEEDDDYDNKDDDDDDDEEFKPDEIDDYVDDEDELSVMEKNKKVGRPFVREKGFAKGWKNRNSNHKVVKKQMTTKPRKNRRLVIESSSGDDDGELTGKNLVVEERSKKVSGRRRRRRFKANSDSDFVSSGSSDYEYTISEEEREQVRGGNKVCTSLTTSLRTSKRLEEEVPHQQLKRPGRKGKEKVVEDLKKEVGKKVCGICLTEQGKKTVRGILNCCDHYFCFPCIMEWSKVESRCPLCKQRFVTIGKPARSNTSFDLRTIPVPERDQVYQPTEEELRGYLDPYENVICTECQQGGDDSLMLLCDVCDSPAHTYCVGLGHVVPEGNWYCEGCRPTALGSLNPQGISPTPDRRATSNLSGVSSSPAYNVGEGIDLNISYVPDTPLTQENGGFSSSRRAVVDFHAGSPAFASGANTVSERRRIRLMFPNLLDNSDGRPNGISTTSSGTRLFGYQLDREIARQRTITPENNTPFMHSRDVDSSGLSYLSGRGQHPTSTSGIGMEFNPGLNYEQLPPFSSISVVGSDASASLFACRERLGYTNDALLQIR